MAREISITYDEVALVCNQMTARAEQVSAQRVHQALDNRGNLASISKLVDEWRERTGKRPDSSPPQIEMPPNLLQASAQWASTLWREAIDASEAIYQRKADVLEDFRSACEAKIATAEAARHAAEASLAAARKELGELRQLAAEHDKEVQALRTQEATAQATISAQGSQLANLNEECSRLQMEVEKERRRHFEEVEQLRVQFEQTLSAVRDSHRGELARIKDLAETERRRLSRETEELRQVAQTREETLCEQLAAQSVYVEQYRQQSQWAREQAVQATGRVEALREQLSSVQEQLSALQIRYAVAESLIPNPEVYRERIRLAVAFAPEGEAVEVREVADVSNTEDMRSRIKR